MDLSLKQKAAFGVGAVGKDMVYALSSSYVMYFYQDVLGLSATFVGLVLMAARVFDALNDPFMGVLVAKRAQPLNSAGGTGHGRAAPSAPQNGPESGRRGLQQRIGILVFPGMKGRAVLSRPDSEKRAGALAQVVAEVLAPAHGGLQLPAAAQLQHPLGAAGVVHRGRKYVLNPVVQRQPIFRRQGTGKPEDRMEEGLQILIPLGPQGEAHLRPGGGGAEGPPPHLHPDDGTQRHAAVPAGPGQLRKRAQQPSHRLRR